MAAPKPIPGMPVFLDAEELAAYLRVSIKYVYEHPEELGGVRLGKVWRFRSDRLPDCLPASSED